MHSDTQYILQAPNVLISSDLDTGGTKVGIPSYANLAYTSNTGAALVPTPVAMTQDEGSPCCLCDIEQGDARPLRIKVFPSSHLSCVILFSLLWVFVRMHPHNFPLTPSSSPFPHLFVLVPLSPSLVCELFFTVHQGHIVVSLMC